VCRHGAGEHAGGREEEEEQRGREKKYKIKRNLKTILQYDIIGDRVIGDHITERTPSTCSRRVTTPMDTILIE
jgi:hypothetical protein